MATSTCNDEHKTTCSSAKVEDDLSGLKDDFVLLASKICPEDCKVHWFSEWLGLFEQSS